MTIKRKLILFSILLGVFSLGLILLVLVGARHVVNDLVSQGLGIGNATSSAMGNRFPFVVVISIIMILFLMIYTILRSIIQPLVKLSEAANQIKNGNLDFEVYYEKKDEFGQVFQDFNDMRLQLKESVMARQRLEELRMEMISNISHDLKTPITSINGYIQGIMTGIADTPEKQEKYMGIITVKANEIDNLVNELFLFSKLDSKQISFVKVPIDIVQYAKEVFEEIAFEKKNINISLDSKLPLDTLVLLDGFHFKRVLVNIAENSMKYRRLEMVDLCVNLYERRSHVIIKIADNGKGISNSDAEKIFDRFYRSDSARMNPGNGSGLGLSIAKQIVEGHDGNIWAKGVNGKGMSIYISIPKISKEKIQ